MNCNSYVEADLYREDGTGLYIVLGSRKDSARDAPAYLRTNIPAQVLTVRGLGDDFTAPIYKQYVFLPRPVPSDFSSPYPRPHVVISVAGFGTSGLALYGNACAKFSDADDDFAYPWPWVWLHYSDDFLGRFGTPPKNVPDMKICRPSYMLGWWGGSVWQALPMSEATAETKGGGGYLVVTATNLGGYLLPAQNRKTLISPPVPPSSLHFLRTALYSFCLFLREGEKDFNQCETVSASIESEGGNYFLKVTIEWHI